MSERLHFGLGEFFGAFERRRRQNDMELSLMAAQGYVERHTHLDAHFVLVMDGAYETAAAKGDILGPMALVYNPPGVTHQDRFASPSGRFACLSIAASTIDQFKDACALPDKPSLVRDPRAAIEFLRGAVDEDADIEELSCLALADAGGRRPAMDRTAPRWLSAVLEDIESRIPGRVSVAELASQAGVHPVHLARVFRKFVGVTPAIYAQRARICFAYGLMRRRELTLAEIAYAAGYADQSHLARAFRRATQMAPDAFRKGRPAVI